MKSNDRIEPRLVHISDLPNAFAKTCDGNYADSAELLANQLSRVVNEFRSMVAAALMDSNKRTRVALQSGYFVAGDANDTKSFVAAPMGFLILFNEKDIKSTEEFVEHVLQDPRVDNPGPCEN